MALHDTLSLIKFSTTFSFPLFFIEQVTPSFPDDLCFFELLETIFPSSRWSDGDHSSSIIVDLK
jgi:hypothetical protein